MWRPSGDQTGSTSPIPPEVTGGYEIVAHDYDPANPPDAGAMDGGGIVATSPSPAPSGSPGTVEPNGLGNAHGLCFYKIRGLSPCTANYKGPTQN